MSACVMTSSKSNKDRLGNEENDANEDQLYLRFPSHSNSFLACEAIPSRYLIKGGTIMQAIMDALKMYASTGTIEGGRTPK